jgi:hypothetical protein
MTSHPQIVTDLSEERLLRDMAALASAEAKVRDLKAKVSAGCRKWSDANGYRVVLRPEQVKREIQP